MENTIDCQRQGMDRRSHGFRTFVYSFIKSRRHQTRREVCLTKSHYADNNNAPVLFALTISIMGLSCTDAFFTLMLIQQGAQEINPVMNSLLEINTQLFVSAKMAITATCLIFLLAHRNFWLLKGIVRVHHVLPVFFLGYCVLISHQLNMLNNVPQIL